MYFCYFCHKHFSRLTRDGACPICQKKVKVTCSHCGFVGEAQIFAANKDSCPECGTGSLDSTISTGTTVTACETVTETVLVSRQCSKCGNSWKASLEAKATASGTARTERAAKEIAHRDAEKSCSEKAWGLKENVSCQVLCPVCGNFAEETMHRYFPDGYRRSLKSLYRKERQDEAREARGCLAFLVFISFLGSPFWFVFLIAEEAHFLTVLLSILVVVVLIIITRVDFRRKSQRASSDCAIADNRIDAMSKRELFELLVDTYKAHGESLEKISWWRAVDQWIPASGHVSRQDPKVHGKTEKACALKGKMAESLDASNTNCNKRTPAAKGRISDPSNKPAGIHVGGPVDVGESIAGGRFQVVLMDSNASKAKVMEDFADLFKIRDPAIIERIFLEDRFILKKNVDYRTAIRYKKAMRSIGIKCLIEKLSKQENEETPRTD